MGEFKEHKLTAAIRGAGGGKNGGKQRSPIESPDTLHSTAYARIIDLISEGECYGFADQEHSLTGYYANETRMANDDGSLNFSNVDVDSRVGTQNQDFYPGFEGVENEIVAGVELTYATHWTQSLSNVQLNAVRIRISTPALSLTDTSNGDIKGASVSYSIAISTDGGGYVPVLNSAFTGKASSKYERSHLVELPPADTGWTIRVTRLTADSTSAALQNKTFIESYTEIVYAKLRMPMSASVKTVIDAEQFPNIPVRAFHWKGRIIKVPSNYNADTREYSGFWDGTFQLAYSNNPAWVFYDMAINDRYGLGHLVPVDLVDKWTLYRIAQYCDQFVDDGFGGTEPRFTANLYLQSRNDAARVMQDMATMFRGIVYVASGTIMASSDMPEDPVYAYGPSHVIDGKFTYSGSAKKARHTVALVSWNDMSNMCRAKVEYVEDEDGIARYGYQPTEIIAIGCTSRGQARRFGRYLLATERLETDLVTFAVGLDGTIPAPGKIVLVNDPLRANKRNSGRVSSAGTGSITVDALPEGGIAAGDTLYTIRPDGTLMTRIVDSVVGRVVTPTVAFDVSPIMESAWMVEGSTLQAQRFRVLSVAEKNNNNEIGFDIVGVRHVEEKFAFVESGLILDLPPIIGLPVTGVVAAPANIVFDQRDVHEQNTTQTIVTCSWDTSANAIKYGFKWRLNGGAWTTIPEGGSTLVELNYLQPGELQVEVYAADGTGAKSAPSAGSYMVLANQQPPRVVTELQSDLDDQAAALAQEAADRLAADGVEAAARAAAIAAEATDRANAIAAEAAARTAAIQASADSLWAVVGDITGADSWSNIVAYPSGDLVKDSGHLYRALQAVPAGTALTNTAYWQYIGDYSSLGEAVSATVTRVNLHEDRLDTDEANITAAQTDIDALQIDVADKASASALSALETRVTSTESVNTSQATSITNLQTDVATKASASALNALDVRVTATETTNTSQATELTNLKAGSLYTVLPSTFEQGGRFFTNSRTGNPTSVADAVGTVVNDATLGVSFEITSFAAAGSNILTKGVMRADSNKKYKVVMRFRASTLPSDGSYQMSFVCQGMDNAYAATTQTFTPVSGAISNTNEFIMTATFASAAGTGVDQVWPQSGSKYLRFGLRLDTAETSLVLRVSELLVTEVATDVANANAISSLDARVTTTESGITANSTSITNLTASLSDLQSSAELVQSPSFEDAAGWALATNFTIATDATTARSGDKYLNVAGGTAGASINNNRVFKCRESEVFDVAFFKRQVGATAPDGYVRLSVRWYKADGTQITFVNTTASSTVADTNWLEVTGSMTAPADAVQGRIVVQTGHTVGVWGVDDVRVERRTVLGTSNASAITTLDARVTTAEGNITSQSSSITSLSNEVTTARNGGASLDARLDGIDTTVGTKASTTALNALDSRVTATENTNTAQATSITALTARLDDGNAAPFAPFISWNFASTAESWTVTGATIAVANDVLTITSSTTDPTIGITGISIPGTPNNKVRARIRRTAGAGWDGTCYYGTSGHGYSGSYGKTLPSTVLPANGTWFIAEWDMANLTAGGTDWTANTIISLRLDLGNSASDVFEVDWIAVGARSAGTTASAFSALDARVTSAEGVNTSQATSITNLNAALYSPGGANVITNPSGQYGIDGWTAAGGVTLSSSSAIDGQRIGFDAGTSTTRYAYYEAPCSPNFTYTFAVDLAINNGATGAFYIDILYLDGSNNVLLDSSNVTATANGSWVRPSITAGPAPSGTTKIRARIVASSATWAWLFFKRAKLELGSTATPYSEEGSTLQSASATEALDVRVTTNESGITTLQAKWTVNLDVNGYISGVTSVNNGTSADFTILADKFRIIAPAGGARTEFGTGNWRVYDSSGTLRVRMGIW